jgi:transcriptional regulator with XRE-family HTH domain
MDTYEKIKELCRERGINITNLCTECEIPRSTLSDFRSGRTKSLSFEKLSKISDYFGVSIDYLTGREVQSDENAAKVALFGGGTVVTDEMWNEVKRYADYIKERENGNK